GLQVVSCVAKTFNLDSGTNRNRVLLPWCPTARHGPLLPIGEYLSTTLGGPMRKSPFLCVLLVALTVAMSLPLYAGGPGLSGAIFTTLPDGSEVNFNIYSDKTL